MEFEGIVVRVTPFKDNDMMVNVLSHERMYSFLARGVLKMSSKNAPSVLLYAHSSFETSKGKEGFLLKRGQLINSYKHARDNLNTLLALDFIGELTSKLIQSEDCREIYPFLVKCLDLLNHGFDVLNVVTIYFAKVLKASGYGIDVDECVISHQTSQIVAISFVDGGFISKDCYESEKHTLLSARLLNIYRFIFKCGVEDVERANFTKSECINILEKLAEFASDISGTNLKSLPLLLKL